MTVPPRAALDHDAIRAAHRKSCDRCQCTGPCVVIQLLDEARDLRQEVGRLNDELAAESIELARFHKQANLDKLEIHRLHEALVLVRDTLDDTTEHIADPCRAVEIIRIALAPKDGG